MNVKFSHKNNCLASQKKKKKKKKKKKVKTNTRKNTGKAVSTKCHNQTFECGSSHVAWFVYIETPHEIMALYVLRKLILQTHMLNHPVGTLRLLGYFMCVNSKGSGETPRMRRTA